MKHRYFALSLLVLTQYLLLPLLASADSTSTHISSEATAAPTTSAPPPETFSISGIIRFNKEPITKYTNLMPTIEHRSNLLEEHIKISYDNTTARFHIDNFSSKHIKLFVSFSKNPDDPYFAESFIGKLDLYMDSLSAEQTANLTIDCYQNIHFLYPLDNGVQTPNKKTRPVLRNPVVLKWASVPGIDYYKIQIYKSKTEERGLKTIVDRRIKDNYIEVILQPNDVNEGYSFLIQAFNFYDQENGNGAFGFSVEANTEQDRQLIAEIPDLSIDLGTLGGTNSYAAGINDQGQIAGYSQIAGDYATHAFLYDGTTMKDIGTLGGRDSHAADINNHGHIAGSSQIAGDSATHAFLYDGTTMKDLGTLGGRDSCATDINNRGQIVGFSQIVGNSATHAFLYDGTTMKDLGTLGGNNSYAHGINDLGQVVGYSQIGDHPFPHAFLYDGTTMKDLGILGLNSSFSEAYDINNDGWIVGSSTRKYATHAFLYDGMTMNDLGALGDGFSVAYGINDLGQVVGHSQITSDPWHHAFLYNGTPLKQLWINAQTSSAVSINNKFQIVGRKVIYDKKRTITHAFLYDGTTIKDPGSKSDNSKKDITQTEGKIEKAFSETPEIIPSYESLNYTIISSMEKVMSDLEIDGSDGKEFKPGTYFVYKTSEGRYGKMLIENLEPSFNNRLTISWVTYAGPNSIYSSGSGLVIRGTWWCDLDRGEECTLRAPNPVYEIYADFHWRQINKTERILMPGKHVLFKLVYRPQKKHNRRRYRCHTVIIKCFMQDYYLASVLP